MDVGGRVTMAAGSVESYLIFFTRVESHKGSKGWYRIREYPITFCILARDTYVEIYIYILDLREYNQIIGE